jgi:RHS repeat-associated protein
VNCRYTLGTQLISQERRTDGSSSTWTASYYGHDGLGSTRALYNASGVATDTYNYTAYGKMMLQLYPISGSPTVNNYLFAGEQWDPDLKLYYNRARYLNVDSGRFTSRDTFEGGEEDVANLHRYLYVGGDPVNQVDRTGHYSSWEQFLGYEAEEVIQEQYSRDHRYTPPELIDFGTRLYYSPTKYLKPDIQNHDIMTWIEIKPLSIAGVRDGELKRRLNKRRFPAYRPESEWSPPKIMRTESDIVILVFNVYGVVYYQEIDLMDVGVLSLIGPVSAKSLLNYAIRVDRKTVGGALRVSKKMAIGGKAADNTRFEEQVGVAGVLTTMGGL